MRLADYLAQKAQSAEEFAREVGVDPVSVRRYLKGKRLPKWDVMQRITKATKKAVTANDFVEERPPKRVRPNQAEPRAA